ncbi:enoyl-CoA hydratase [Ornithinibacillus gellani]|uniref:enoyl-CoA hydratase/isomerase family protein n=1 Tax=Ornithinibacillus gellani TaxID=2293253 RepID=UPI000F4702A8|nr:enoyl-CoA hydratase-related protein [Ornithinibacillus gellani]TQS72009.1 enoyl-CoA hydratase [Ornithinibacillus gellani]
MTDYIQATVDGHIGVIQLNRPEVANALNRQMVDEIVQQLEKFDQDRAIRVIVIKGNHQAFAAGADIEEMIDDTPFSLEQLNQFAVWDRIRLIKKPLLAAVNGYALGGGFELVLHCDLIIAAADAQFGFPEVTLGVMPGAGGTQLLTKMMGRQKALEWIWLGERMPAEVAYQYGIVNRLVAPELVEEETMRLASQLATRAPFAMKLIKEAVDAAFDLRQEGMTVERKNFYLAFSSNDQQEGMQAFMEKRPPSFKGD